MLFPWFMRKFATSMQRKMADQMRQQQQRTTGFEQQGNVVYKKAPNKKDSPKHNSSEGEYIDFEEIKD